MKGKSLKRYSHACFKTRQENKDSRVEKRSRSPSKRNERQGKTEGENQEATRLARRSVDGPPEIGGEVINEEVNAIGCEPGPTATIGFAAKGSSVITDTGREAQKCAYSQPQNPKSETDQQETKALDDELEPTATLEFEEGGSETEPTAILGFVAKGS